MVGEVFPANQLEQLLPRDVRPADRRARASRTASSREVDPERFRAITESTLEGLAKRELNLSAIVGKSAEAKERRLVPEVIEDFFVEAAPRSPGSIPSRSAKDSHVYRIGRVPRTLLPVGERLEPRFGRLGREYEQVVFDKALLAKDPDAGMGHARPSALRGRARGRARRASDDDLRRGAVFYDLHRKRAGLLDVFAASIKDGRGNTLHRRLFVVETAVDRRRWPSASRPIFLEHGPGARRAPAAPDEAALPDRVAGRAVPLRAGAPAVACRGRGRARAARSRRSREHVEISLNALIDRQQLQLAELLEPAGRRADRAGPRRAHRPGRAAPRRAEQPAGVAPPRSWSMERHCTIADITHLGRAWVLPHPERTVAAASRRWSATTRSSGSRSRAAIAHEEARGWEVESVEAENRGFDLISRRPHPEDPKTFIEVRFIEVKGRAGVGEVALSANEYQTAERLKDDYWLYVVFNCGATPELHADPGPGAAGLGAGRRRSSTTTSDAESRSWRQASHE